jgi:hypothetical protein
MRRFVPIVGLAVLLVALAPTAALAKAPSAVSIDGPGIDGGIDIDAGGRDVGGVSVVDSTVSRLGEHTGLLELGFADFGDHAAGLAEQQPDGDLGPEYRIEWTVPNSAGTADTFVQRLYPYAEAGPVTYTPPGQSYMGVVTLSGWYVGGSELRAALTEVGVPEQPPATGPAATPISFGIVALCALGLVALWIGRTMRERQHAVA